MNDSEKIKKLNEIIEFQDEIIEILESNLRESEKGSMIIGIVSTIIINALSAVQVALEYRNSEPIR